MQSVHDLTGKTDAYVAQLLQNETNICGRIETNRGYIPSSFTNRLLGWWQQFLQVGKYALAVAGLHLLMVKQSVAQAGGSTQMKDENLTTKPVQDTGTATVKGKVLDEKGYPLDFAMAILKKDEAILKVTRTNEDGDFLIKLDSVSPYKPVEVVVKYLGYPDNSTGHFLLEIGKTRNIPIKMGPRGIHYSPLVH